MTGRNNFHILQLKKMVINVLVQNTYSIMREDTDIGFIATKHMKVKFSETRCFELSITKGYSSSSIRKTS